MAWHVSHTELFEKFVGRWEGTCRTWVQPGTLADESKVSGDIAWVLGDQFLRHTYESSIEGKPRHGEELIAFNSLTETYQVSWVDDFHMNYAIMFSEGKSTDRGFSVRGNYDVGKNQPAWGWRTEVELVDGNHLTITAYNIQPDGKDAKAVETVYRRVTERHGRPRDFPSSQSSGDATQRIEEWSSLNGRRHAPANPSSPAALRKTLSGVRRGGAPPTGPRR